MLTHSLMIAATALLAAAISAFAQQSSSGQGIGYPTVAAALEALRGKSGAKFSIQGGWTIVEESASHTIWSFTPPNHPAHPAAVKRTIVEKDGAIYFQMNGLCQAKKPDCDKLLAEFEALNDRIRENLRRGARP